MVKIGYTTGVFDLFHIGHLNILRNAKLECDHLIVGITTDELSLEGKGKMPVIPFSERMTIVESIKSDFKNIIIRDQVRICDDGNMTLSR